MKTPKPTNGHSSSDSLDVGMTRNLGRQMVSLATMLLAWFGTWAAQGADIHVPADYPTVQQGLYASRSGDRVVLAAGTYMENVILVSNVTVCASDGLDPTSVVVGAASGAVFSGGDIVGVVLRGFTVDGFGSASTGIWVNDTEILVDGLIVTGCQAGMDYAHWPTIKVLNSRFHHNEVGAVINGGVVRDSTFSQNSQNGISVETWNWSENAIRNCQIASNGNFGIAVNRLIDPLTIGPDNSIFSNAVADVANLDGFSVVRAEGNWWGQAPPDPSRLLGNVDYIPYVGGSAPPANGIIQVPADYPTIQMGLYAASAGGRVVLAAGTYEANVLLVPDVTICASDGLDPTSVVVGAASGAVFSGGDFGGVVLRGFTIDGHETATQGIWANSTEILIDRMIVTRCQNGLEEYNWPRIHVLNSWFHGNEDGMNLGGTMDTLIEGTVISDNVNDGIALASWPNGTIRNCRIADNGRNGITVAYEFDGLVIGPGNSIYGNRGFDIAYGDPDGYLPAENNWWGQAPPNLSRFSGNIDYIPYLAQQPSLVVTPTNQDFGSILLGETADQSFAVMNIGTGTLAGTVSVGAPFSVIGPSHYNLGVGQSTVVTIRYCPLAVGSHSNNATFSGGASASRPVIGNAHLPPELAVAPTTRTVASTAGTTTFVVTNSGGGSMLYDVSTEVSWLDLVDGEYGLNGGTITIAHLANPGMTARTGLVAVTTSDAGNSPVVVMVIQAGIPASLAIIPTGANVPAAASSGQEVAVMANVSWTAARGANSTWITITGGSSGSDNGTVTYNVAVNAADAARTGSIVVSGGGITRTCTVVQAAAAVDPGPDRNTLPHLSDNQSIAFTADGSFFWAMIWDYTHGVRESSTPGAVRENKTLGYRMTGYLEVHVGYLYNWSTGRYVEAQAVRNIRL